MPKGIPKIDKRESLIGKKFGRLLVKSLMPRSESKKRTWLCECSCGGSKLVTTNLLNVGTSSCGCLQRESFLSVITKHGKSGTPEYEIWKAMKQRCHNPNHKDYADYGGRGIFVCQEWRDSFQAFIDHMGERPSKKHTIERVDVNGGYCPENCIWIELVMQARNRRSNLTFNGKTMCLTEWSKYLGISYATLTTRRSIGIVNPEELFAPAGACRKGKWISKVNKETIAARRSEAK